MGAEQRRYVCLFLIYAFAGVLGCALAIVLGFFLGKATYRRRIYGRLQKGNSLFNVCSVLLINEFKDDTGHRSGFVIIKSAPAAGFNFLRKLIRCRF